MTKAALCLSLQQGRDMVQLGLFHTSRPATQLMFQYMPLCHSLIISFKSRDRANPATPRYSE